MGMKIPHEKREQPHCNLFPDTSTTPACLTCCPKQLVGFQYTLSNHLTRSPSKIKFCWALLYIIFSSDIRVQSLTSEFHHLKVSDNKRRKPDGGEINYQKIEMNRLIFEYRFCSSIFNCYKLYFIFNEEISHFKMKIIH